MPKSVAPLFHYSYSSVFLIGLFTFCTPVTLFAQENETAKVEKADRAITGFESIEESQPLWEFGAGGGYAQTPNYPASSERNHVALAAPYFIYRGDIFRVGDGGGVRAVVAEQSNWELDLSFDGALSANSDEDDVRQGMPELDFLFEVGPQLVYLALEDTDERGRQKRLNFRLQARAVFSTDFKRINQRGYVIEPEIEWQQRGFVTEKTSLSVRFSMTFATEALHDYFYQVDPVFATNERDVFDAKGGYLGSEFSVGLGFPISKNIRGFIGGSISSHHGAENEQSPLFENKLNWQAGAGFVWRLYTSDARANY